MRKQITSAQPYKLPSADLGKIRSDFTKYADLFYLDQWREDGVSTLSARVDRYNVPYELSGFCMRYDVNRTIKATYHDGQAVAPGDAGTGKSGQC